MLYNNCRELPIHNFFEISRSSDLNYLVKSGKPPKKEILHDKFIDIIDEYNGLFTTKKHQVNVNETKLYILNLKLMNLEIITSIIKSSGITDEIKEISKTLRIRPDEIGVYVSGIKNEIKKIILEMSAKNENEPSGNNGESLEKTLTLVKENGFNFDRFTTPVIEFVYAINRLEEKNKQQEIANKK